MAKDTMAKDTLLTPDQMKTSLNDLNSQALEPWVVDDGKLHRRYKFSGFSAAFAFMTQVAMVCETMEHHPKWTNVWNVVDVDLLTHRSKGITTLDMEMAVAMENIARQYLS